MHFPNLATCYSTAWFNRLIHPKDNQEPVKGCADCGYTGIAISGAIGDIPCGCMFREAFDSCYRRYAKERESGSTLVYVESPTLASRKSEEYCADFENVARRHLDQFEWRLFKQYIAGARVEHEMFHIKAHLGKVYGSLVPYPLYPPRHYFDVPIQTSLSTRINAELGREGRPAVKSLNVPIGRSPYAPGNAARGTHTPNLWKDN